LQTSQTEEARAADVFGAHPGAHFRLDRPTALHDKTRPDQGRDKRFPGVRLLVGKNDNQFPCGFEDIVAFLKDSSHPIFINGFRFGLVSSVAARIVNKLAIVLIVIPFR